MKKKFPWQIGWQIEWQIERPDRWLLVGLAIVALIARLLPGPRIVDDAYITFRYAHNLITGHGFVYNIGERVLGTTTPLYTLLMAGLALLTGSRDFPTLALCVNAVAGAAAVGLLYRLGKRFSGHRGVAVGGALLWAIAPYSVTFAIGGMETDLTIALLLAAADAHIAGRSRRMAVWCALALLARPDTAILLGLLWLDHGWERLRQRRPIPLLKEGMITAGILAPWIAFGTLYFGSPLPHSIAAKSVTYRLPPTAAFIRLLQHYATPFFEHRILPPTMLLGTFGVYLALWAFGGREAIRRNRRAWPIVVYPWAYFTVFAIANPLLFRWYLSPPMPFYFLLIVHGLWVIIHQAGRRCTSVGLAMFLLAAAGCTLNAWELHPDHGPDRPAPEMAWFQLELLYSQAADIVRTQAHPDDTLCAGDIGVLGYRTGMHILDTVGLVTPASTRHYPADPDIYVINYAIPASLVLDLDPDYIVILEIYGRRGLLPDTEFQARYRLIETLETDIYGSKGMLIFGRADR